MPPSIAKKNSVAPIAPDLIVHHDEAYDDADGAEYQKRHGQGNFFNGRTVVYSVRAR